MHCKPQLIILIETVRYKFIMIIIIIIIIYLFIYLFIFNFRVDKTTSLKGRIKCYML